MKPNSKTKLYTLKSQKKQPHYECTSYSRVSRTEQRAPCPENHFLVCFGNIHFMSTPNFINILLVFKHIYYAQTPRKQEKVMQVISKGRSQVSRDPFKICFGPGPAHPLTEIIFLFTKYQKTCHLHLCAIIIHPYCGYCLVIKLFWQVPN